MHAEGCEWNSFHVANSCYVKKIYRLLCYTRPQNPGRVAKRERDKLFRGQQYKHIYTYTTLYASWAEYVVSFDWPGAGVNLSNLTAGTYQDLCSGYN